MNILCVVPARGGSKSIPRKNIKELNGIPLIAYTLREAIKVSRINDLVVSTEDQQIAQVAKKYGANVPFLRPKELATDSAETFPVVKHCLNFMERKNNKTYDAILLLQPTCPLRKSQHIEKAIDLLKDESFDTVLSVMDVNGRHPFRMKRIEGSHLVNFIDQGFEDMRPRQILPKVYIRSGAIYLSRRHVILEQGQLVGNAVIPLMMNESESINIDSHVDFYTAEKLIMERSEYNES